MGLLVFLREKPQDPTEVQLLDAVQAFAKVSPISQAVERSGRSQFGASQCPD